MSKQHHEAQQTIAALHELSQLIHDTQILEHAKLVSDNCLKSPYLLNLTCNSNALAYALVYARGLLMHHPPALYALPHKYHTTSNVRALGILLRRLPTLSLPLHPLTSNQTPGRLLDRTQHIRLRRRRGALLVRLLHLRDGFFFGLFAGFVAERGRDGALDVLQIKKWLVWAFEFWSFWSYGCCVRSWDVCVCV